MLGRPGNQPEEVRADGGSATGGILALGKECDRMRAGGKLHASDREVAREGVVRSEQIDLGRQGRAVIDPDRQPAGFRGQRQRRQEFMDSALLQMEAERERVARGARPRSQRNRLLVAQKSTTYIFCKPRRHWRE